MKRAVLLVYKKPWKHGEKAVIDPHMKTDTEIPMMKTSNMMGRGTGDQVSEEPVFTPD